MCFVSRREFTSSFVSVRVLLLSDETLTLIFTTYLPPLTLPVSIRFFDAIADSFACWSVDEVTCFGGGKAFEAETKPLDPPFFELTMFNPKLVELLGALMK
jgi:hypothetical protein